MIPYRDKNSVDDDLILWIATHMTFTFSMILKTELTKCETTNTSSIPDLLVKLGLVLK